MSIAILVPTKGRPEQFKRMHDSMLKTAQTCRTVYTGLSREEMLPYQYAMGHDVSAVEWFELPDGQPTAHKWNVLAEKCIANLYMLGADDMVFATPLWDMALLDHYNALENKIHVYSLQDSRDESGTPHIIVTREYIEAMGYFVPPIFLHWFIDSWTVEIAKSNNCFTHLKDYLLIHDKPSDKGHPDATHTGIRAMGWHERDKWVAEHSKDWLSTQKWMLSQKLLPKILVECAAL